MFQPISEWCTPHVTDTSKRTDGAGGGLSPLSTKCYKHYKHYKCYKCSRCARTMRRERLAWRDRLRRDRVLVSPFACYLRMLPPHTALHLTSTEAADEEELEDPVESRTRTTLATTGWRTGGKHAHPPGHPPVASLCSLTKSQHKWRRWRELEACSTLGETLSASDADTCR